MICKCERKWLSISASIPNARDQHQITTRSQSYPETELKTGKGKTVKIFIKIPKKKNLPKFQLYLSS